MLLWLFVVTLSCTFCYSLSHGSHFRNPSKMLLGAVKSRSPQAVNSPLNVVDENDLLLDEKQVSEEERERLDYIRRLTIEADDLVKAGGFSINGGHNIIEIQRAVQDTQWSGQSDVDITRASQYSWGDLFNRPGLVVVDFCSLLVFASIGRSSHNEYINLLNIMSTAAPFILSWFTMAPFLGAYSREATASKSKVVSKLILPCLVSTSLAVLLRGFIKGAQPPIPFIVISLVSTLSLHSIFRYFYISLVGTTSDAEGKDAGALEVFKMISTLVKRW